MKNVIKMSMGKRLVALSLFILVVCCCLASVPVARASTSPISLQEGSLITELDGRAGASDLKKAEIARQKIERLMEKQIQRSLLAEDSVTVLSSTDYVYLGTDKTFTDADKGSSGKSWWGWAPRWFGSDYSFSEKEATAASLVGPGGWGGAGAWAWIGKEFHVIGYGSRAANIRMQGHMWGFTSAFGGGSATSEVTLVVYDWHTGTTYSTTIYHKSAGGVGFFEVNRNFNNGFTVKLKGGHTYRVYVLVETSAAVYALGQAGADFGPQDGDEPGHVRYSQILIDF